MADDECLSIVSPATGKRETFTWTLCKDGELRDENSEIVDIISWIVDDVDELTNEPELSSLLPNVDRSSYTSVSELCLSYNKAITKLRDKWNGCSVIPSFLNRKASRSHVQFILYQCYNRAVAEPDRLNQYPPFSPQVYGETSFELISQMIDTVNISADESFIDLGSGVGQVVLQVAACSDAKFCYGIEKAEYPAMCAYKLDSEFRHWMEFYGKPYRPYLLERGDFLSAEYQDRITSAGVLFANNFAFGPEVDHQLKQRFANLKEGARIISSKAFCPLNFRITDRNLGDIGSIMHVSCLNPIQDAVSWTDKPFSYYVHTIDRSLLERYFLRLKNPKLKDDAETIRRDRKGRIISDNLPKDTPQVYASGSAHGSTKDSLLPCAGLRVSNDVPTTARHRRSKSVEAISDRRPSRRNQFGSRTSRSKRRYSKSKAARRLRDRVSQHTRAKRSLSSKRNVNSKTAGSLCRTDAMIGERLATLSFASNEQYDGILRSSSFSTFGHFTSSTSGYTTPTGSTSISSAAFTNDDCPISSGSCTESERFSSCTCITSDRTLSAPSVPLPDLSSSTSTAVLANAAASFHADSSVPAASVSTSDANINEVCVEASGIETDSSVANRRAVRKCRQLTAGSQNTNSRTLSEISKSRDSTAVTGRLSGLRSTRRFTKPRFRESAGHVHLSSKKLERLGKQQLQQLDLLHTTTVAKYRLAPKSKLSERSCNDPTMSSFTCHYQPRELPSLNAAKEHASTSSGDPHVGHSNDPVPLALTQYLELSKRVFMEHFTMLRSPSYADEVRHQLECEQARHAELLELTRSTEQAINKLHADGTELLRRFTKRLGILITTPSAFFAQARKLIKHHHALEAKIADFRKQISELSAANQDLVRRHQVEATRLLSAAVQSTNCSPPTAVAHSNPRKLSIADPSSRRLASSSRLSESPILARTLTDIPPPPPLSKVRMSIHSNPPRLSTAHRTRSPHSIPLLLPQSTTSVNLTVSSHDQPPILYRLDEQLTNQPIPPPPPLLPMHTLPSYIPNSSVSIADGRRQSALEMNPINSVPATAYVGDTLDNCQHRLRSIHSSLQDLITSEFCGQCAPPKLITTNHSNFRSTSHTNQSTLPPRKRTWEPLDRDELQPLKHHRSHSPGSRHPDSTHLSPPTLSPMEPRLAPGNVENNHVPSIPKQVCVSEDIGFHCSSSSFNTPPPLLYSHDPQCRPNPLLSMNQRTPSLSTMSLAVAQASGQ